MKWLLLHPSGIRFCFVGEKDLGKQAVFCACLVAVANHLLHMCSTEGSSWLPTQVRGPSLAYEHPVGPFGKELSSEYKIPLCLRSPTILKDSVAFKNSLKIGVGFSHLLLYGGHCFHPCSAIAETVPVSQLPLDGLILLWNSIT